MEPERRPIGYWLTHLDRLIGQAFERTLDNDAAFPVGSPSLHFEH